MTPDSDTFTWNVTVRYGEAGPDGRAKLSAIADWFQEAAGLNANMLNFGDVELFKRGLTWVLTRMIIRIDRMPHAGETVSVRTWPSFYDHLWHRGYQIVSQQGEIMAEASGAWTVMNQQTRHITPLPDDIAVHYPQNPIPVIPFSQRILPRVKTPEAQCPITIRRDDLDMNGHVNNARYLSWILEPLPDTPQRFTVDLQFRSETFPGQLLNSVCSGIVPLTQDDTPLLGRIHAIVRTDENGKSVDVCRAVTLIETE